MPHFLIKSQDVVNGSVTLTEPDLLAHIVGALRVRAGEEIKLIDENKIEYFCKVAGVSKRIVVAQVLSQKKSTRFLPFKVTLVQAVLKPDAMNLAVANAAQMGVSEFLPVVSDNSTVKFSTVTQKREKWQKVSDEAFKQCERADLMKVLEPVSGFDMALEGLPGCAKNVTVFAERDANATLKQAIQGFNKDNVTVVIGPEGGFSPEEFEFFACQGYPLVSLGNLILKAPNAITAALAQIVYEKTLPLSEVRREKKNG